MLCITIAFSPIASLTLSATLPVYLIVIPTTMSCMSLPIGCHVVFIVSSTWDMYMQFPDMVECFISAAVFHWLLNR
jgi:hypothetical protein